MALTSLIYFDDASMPPECSSTRARQRREGMTLMRASGLPSHYREDGEYPNGPVTG